MRASARFPIAVHTMIEIAYFPSVRLNSDVIAESVGCNPATIRTIYGMLKEAGLIDVRPGTGGLSLTRDPKEISLWDILKSVEPSAAESVFNFPVNSTGVCPIGGDIRSLLISHLDESFKSFETSIDSVSLADIAEELKLVDGDMPLPALKVLTSNLETFIAERNANASHESAERADSVNPPISR